MAPGILYVTMQPSSDLSTDRFEDWYNNEHGPLRLRLPFCRNGYRYRAVDSDGPGKGLHEWMAIYDLDNVEDLNGSEYGKLRGPPVQTQRETDLRPHLDIDRRSYDLLGESTANDYKPLDRVDGQDEGNLLISILYTVKSDQDPTEVDRYYEQEHLPALQKIPGWRRSRRYKTSSIEKTQGLEWLTLHEFAPENGLGTPEFQAALASPWSKKVNEEVMATCRRRIYGRYYTFGPAPRHLASGISDWSSPSTLTRTLPPSASNPHPVVESYITTSDGARLQYRIEGSADPLAPALLCINSVLTHYDIYTPFVNVFLSRNPTYRVLRYLPRGRTSSVGSAEPITLDTLTADAIFLLTALRIHSAAAVIGVSLGGITALNLGLKYPERVPVFLSCDTNASAPPSNPAAWDERLAMADADATNTPGAASEYGGTVGAYATVSGSERIVGEDLAEATVRRWFPQSSYDDVQLAPLIEQTRDMVRTNSLEGFRAGVKALYEYDVGGELAGCKAKGAFLVGAEDGKLPQGMEAMAGKLGSGVKLTVVQGAGHLPMVERPAEVVSAVEALLKGV